MDGAQIIELGIGSGVIVVGAFLIAYIKKVKNKLKKYILRSGSNG